MIFSKWIQFLMLSAVCIATTTTMHCKTIVLFGSSCAGKSTLAKALKAKLGESTLIEHYDTFRRDFLLSEGKRLGLLPDFYDAPTGMQILKDLYAAVSDSTLSADDQSAKRAELAACEQNLESLFYKHIARLSAEQTVILDAFVIKDHQLEALQKHLSEDCLKVFVHIPLNRIPERVASRNATRSAAETRGINRVLCFYPLHYQAIPCDSASPEAISVTLIQEIVENSKSLFQEDKIPTRDELVGSMTRKFCIDEATTYVKLVPRWPHDLIVNTGDFTPDRCAQIIIEHLRPS
jgi:adenylate kinase family enzyme